LLAGIYIRRMKFFYLLGVLLAGALGTPAVAQSAPPASTTALPITPSQRQLAQTLLGTIYSDYSFNKLIDQMLVVQLKAHPEVQPYENELRTFLDRYMSWTALMPDLAEVYAREFTEPELRELLHFYQSPVGKKAATKIPALMQMGMEIGQRHVKDHLPELQKLIMDKAAPTDEQE
jgi:hypothetical protein